MVSYRWLFLTVALGWILLDQLTKWWAVSALDGPTDEILGSLRFTLVENRGSAFSLGTGFGPWIAILAIVVVAVLVWQGRSVRTRSSAVALGLLVGGAVGNLIDRVARSDDGPLGGAVIDFIDLQWWPVFNIADIGVVCGAILMVLSVGRGSPDSSSGR